MYTRVRKAAQGDRISFILTAQKGATVNNYTLIKNRNKPQYDRAGLKPTSTEDKQTVVATPESTLTDDGWDELFAELASYSPITSTSVTYMSNPSDSRGRRNNNWGNIRLTNTPWQGKTAGTDTAFETFATPEDGIRAAAKQIQTYITRDGVDTISGIISKWAPANENNTTDYIQRVSQATGYGADDKIAVTDTEKIKNILKAIFTIELGQELTAEDLAAIDRGIARI